MRFVHDYIQVCLDRGTLSAYAPVAIRGPSGSSCGPELGLADALRSLIGRTVDMATVTEGKELRLHLDDETDLTVSLREVDYSGPEAFALHMDDGTIIVE